MRSLARGTLSCSVVLTVLFVLGLTPKTAHAEARTIFQIEWPAVPGCPTRAAVTAIATRALGDTKTVDRVLARIDLEPPTGAEPWRVRIHTRTLHGSGKRVLEARTCDELARATGLLVALAAMHAREQPVETAPDELVPAADRTEPPPLLAGEPLRLGPPERARAPTQAPSEPGSGFAASAGLVADAGALPSLALGPMLRLEWLFGSYSARAGLVATVGQDAMSGPVGATFARVGVSLDLCRSTVLGPVRPRACLGGEIDQLTATGIGDQRFEAQRTTGLLFGGLGAEWTAASRVLVGLDLRLGPPLRRPAFAVELASGERRTLHQPAVVRGQALLTIGLVF